MAREKSKTERRKRQRRARSERIATRVVVANPSRSDLLNYAKAAPFLGVSQGTLENWVSSGLYNIPFIKVGRLVRFSPVSLSRWLASRERGGEQFAATATANGIAAR